MKHLLWLACLLPVSAYSQVFTEEFCEANPTNGICFGFNLDRARLDANEAMLADHEARIIELEAKVPLPAAKLIASDILGAEFAVFAEANGTDDTLGSFTGYIHQSDGTFAAVSINENYGGLWPTGNIVYSGANCTGTAYYVAAWTWREVGNHEGAIVINSQAGFDGVPYTFTPGPLITTTVASKVLPGHPISAPVCSNYTAVSRADLRLAIAVEGLPDISGPSAAALELLP